MTNRFFGSCLPGNCEEDCVVDVCSTDDMSQMCENVGSKRAHVSLGPLDNSPSTKSPGRKYCLSTSFSRMSPFKTTKIGDLNAGTCGINGQQKFSPRRNLFPKIEPTVNLTESSQSKQQLYNNTNDFDETPNNDVKRKLDFSQAHFHKPLKFVQKNLNHRIQPHSTLNVVGASKRYANTVNENTVNSSKGNSNSNVVSRRFTQVESKETKVAQLSVETERSEAEAGATTSASSPHAMPSATEFCAAVPPPPTAPLKAPRKEKSLGNLCKRFLLTMGELAAGERANDVHLESVAKRMKVEKRRIYDIVNVMEALEAMSKTNKSFYKWRGLAKLPQLMHSLQREAIDAKFPEKIRQVEQAMCNFTELSTVRRSFSSNSQKSLTEFHSLSQESVGTDDGSFLMRTPSNGSLCGSIKDESTSFSQHAVQQDASWTADMSFDDDSDTPSNGERVCGKNSLVHLCRRFLMMLLCDPEKRRVSLDVLSTVLIKDATCEDFTPPDRSRCRRLYDIANVLVSMELIKKVHYLFGTKKIPLFVYCGPEPDASPQSAELSMRHFLNRIGLSAINIPTKQLENDGNAISSPSPLANVTNFSRKYAKTSKSMSEVQQKLALASTKTSSIPYSITNTNAAFLAPHPMSTNTAYAPQSSNQLYAHPSQQLYSTTPSIQYLADIAALVQKRITPQFKQQQMPKMQSPVKQPRVVANQCPYNNNNAHFVDYVSAAEENKENRPPSLMTHKKAAIPADNADSTQSLELPKPKPVNPLTSAFNAVARQQHYVAPIVNNQLTANTTSTSINELLYGILPISTIATSVRREPNSRSTSASPLSPADLMLGRLLVNYNNAALRAAQSAFTAQTQQKKNVTHSVSAILGVSQADNLRGPSLSASPKAFKPLGRSRYSNANLNYENKEN